MNTLLEALLIWWLTSFLITMYAFLFIAPKITPIFRWYDPWVGAFWDRKNRTLYLFPIPCCGLRFQFGEKNGH